MEPQLRKRFFKGCKMSDFDLTRASEEFPLPSPIFSQSRIHHQVNHYQEFGSKYSWDRSFTIARSGSFRTVFELKTGLDTINRYSTSSDEIPDRQKFSIFSRARKSSIQSLRSLSFSFRELIASKKMMQITLIQSVGWIAAAIVLQGSSSQNSP